LDAALGRALNQEWIKFGRKPLSGAASREEPAPSSHWLRLRERRAENSDFSRNLVEQKGFVPSTPSWAKKPPHDDPGLVVASAFADGLPSAP